MSSSRPFLNILLLASLLVPLFLSACADDDVDDLRPPAVTLDALDPSPFTSQKELSGTVDENAAVNVSVNTSAEVGEVIVENGVWSCLISDPEPGSNWVTVAAQDDFNTRTLQFDLLYSIVQVDQVRTVTHLADTTVDGQLVPGGTIESVLLNGEELDLAYPLTASPWSLDIANLREGEANTLEIKAAGPDGQTQPITLTITRNADAVPLTIDPLPRPPNLHADEVVLSGTVEAGAEVAVEISSEAIVGETVYPTETTWQIEIRDLREGPGLFTITAASEGLTTASGTVRFMVETDPLIVSTAPDDGASAVETDAAIEAFFNQAVVGSTVNGESFLLYDGAMIPVSGTVTYDAENKKAVFIPDAPLDPMTTYTAELTADIVDPVGNPVAGEIWSFTTAAE